jgi:D-alanyl-D-alanine carboxypeptidase
MAMNKEAMEKQIQTLLEEKVRKDPTLHNAYLLLHSSSRNIHLNLAAGQTGATPAHPEQIHHVASVGKTFTATLLAMLQERGSLTFDDPIDHYLPHRLTHQLHVYKGTDYSSQIRIRHLLSHTSGLPHFYEDKPPNGPTFQEIALFEPSRRWAAEETILWSKENLTPRFPPGKGTYYSETGYNLLGLIIEHVTGKPYHQNLHDEFFTPLGMDHSYLSQYSQPNIPNPYPPATIYLGQREIIFENYPSFSAFYAGGQTANTSADILKFSQALFDHRLISPHTLSSMQQWQKLWMGVDYGYGLMRIRSLPWTRKYDGIGHMGSIGSYMLYFPHLDIHLVANFNQTTFVRTGMMFLLSILRAVSKLE